MRPSCLGIADPGHEKGLCQARCFLAEAGERAGEQAAPTSIEAPLELEPASRPRGSAFDGVTKATSPPYAIRKEDRNANHSMAARRTARRNCPSLSLEHRLAARPLTPAPRRPSVPPQHSEDGEQCPPKSVGSLVRYDSEDNADHDTYQRCEISYPKGHLLLPGEVRSQYDRRCDSSRAGAGSDRGTGGIKRSHQISMSCVRLIFPSPALAPLSAGLVEVAMQPVHARATAITRTSDLIRFPPKLEVSAAISNGL